MSNSRSDWPPMQIKAAQLPEIEILRRKCMALAMLDALICPEWDYRYFSFNAHWSPGEEMASMRNGEGDDWFLLFDENDAALKGFSHESAVVGANLAKAIQERVPQDFSSFLGEPAFSMAQATFCFWRRGYDSHWSQVNVEDVQWADEDDGSSYLLALLIAPEEAYQEYASDYFEENIPIDAIRAIFAHAPLTASLVASLNPEIEMNEAEEMALEIGYPVAVAPDIER